MELRDKVEICEMLVCLFDAPGFAKIKENAEGVLAEFKNDEFEKTCLHFAKEGLICFINDKNGGYHIYDMSRPFGIKHHSVYRCKVESGMVLGVENHGDVENVYILEIDGQVTSEEVE